MTEKSLPSPDTLRKLLRYEPETGKLFWRPRGKPKFDSRFEGKEAFTAGNGAGYRHGSIHNRRYLAHRVIFAIQSGEWPPHDIDHINGDRGDNRWLNLRAVNRRANSRNQRRRRTNTSGLMGVGWFKPISKWRAYITIDSKHVGLGYFEHKFDAILARLISERDLGFHTNHGR